MDGSFARAFARYLLESVLAPVPPVPVLRVSVPYGLVSQLPSSDDPALFLPFSVFTAPLTVSTKAFINDNETPVNPL